MELFYKNKNIQKLCTENKHATKVLGSEVAIKLSYLISFLIQASTFYEVFQIPQYRVHKLHGDREDQYSLTITRSSKYRLIVYPLDENQKILKSNANEKEMLIKSIGIEILEASEHYD